MKVYEKVVLEPFRNPTLLEFNVKHFTGTYGTLESSEPDFKIGAWQCHEGLWENSIGTFSEPCSFKVQYEKLYWNLFEPMEPSEHDFKIGAW